MPIHTPIPPRCGASPAQAVLAGYGRSHQARLLDEAHSALLAHVATEHGLCVGCLDGARLALAPCPAVRRSVSLIETHGVAAWDAATEFGRSLQ
jgi:hypothetical protein